MTKKDDALVVAMVALGGLVGLLLMILWVGFWSGLTTSVLWGWFIVPFGLPAVGLWHAYGLALIWSALSGLGRKQRNEDKVFLQTLVQVPFAGCVLMAAGWAIRAWM